MNDFEKFTNAELKTILRAYKQHLPKISYSKLLREELIELCKKHLFIDGKKIMIKEIKVSSFDAPEQKIRKHIKKMNESVKKLNNLKKKEFKLHTYDLDEVNREIQKVSEKFDKLPKIKKEEKIMKEIEKIQDVIEDLNDNKIDEIPYSYSGKGLSDIVNIFTNKYSKSTNDILKKYGDWMVNQVKIYRDPVQKEILKILDLIVKNKNQLTYVKEGYDTLYHLYMVLTLKKNGKTVYLLTEKRPSIIWEERKNDSTGTGNTTNYIKLIVSKNPKSYTLSDCIKYAMNAMGNNFHKYDARNNNCQTYIKMLCHGLGLFGADMFIEQNVSDLIQKLPIASKYAKNITDLAGVFDRILGH